MGLRERIEGKARRTAEFPLQVGDSASAEADVVTCRAALDIAQQQVKARVDDGGERTAEDDERIERLRGQLAEAKTRVAETVAMVELQNLADDVWDAILGDAPEDENGDIDLDDVRAALLAASCTDRELQDEAWWDAQLKRPEYSKGDKLAINNFLLRLNLNTPDGRQGKG